MRTSTRPIPQVAALALSLLAFAGIEPSSRIDAQEPASANERFAAAREAADDSDSEAAVKAASEAIELDPKLASAYYLRGRERFRLARFAESVADFDRYVELVPQAASRQWERGIALYYAGQYAKGAEQFALYQTYHDADVENAVWRYLCVAKSEGVARARASMLPIEDDRRVPMMEIYRLYHGDATPDDVFAAVKAGDPDDEELAGRRFYARLYVGLFHDAAGEAELARKYLLEAADEHAETRSINRYMYDVARVHAAKLREPSP